MKKRYKIIIIVVLVFIVIGIAGKIIIDQMEENLEYLMSIEINDIDLSSVEDGTYTGTYKATPIMVEVEVVVVNHIITNITILEHTSGRGDGAEVIVEDVIDQQSLDVDLIAGASYSSKVILLAILDALS
ncbi:MAG: FMN-binding protein [Acholeplasmataceae bacterium]|jgi:uncharacterized protein with FMN-binding domain|nr:FMN-binding protein [Acholeplasmataceae bacterium]